MSKTKLLDRVSAKLVKTEWAERVVSPAYDMLQGAEREKLMDEDPYVFLHVTSGKSSLSAEKRSAANSEALKRLFDAGAYSDTLDSALYLYKLSYEEHHQTAIVGDISIEAFEDGRIMPHERTREFRANDLATIWKRSG